MTQELKEQVVSKMLEARDTIMSKEQANEVLRRHSSSIPVFIKWDATHPDYQFALKQAEISFKAGIREVVEWLTPQIDIGYADNLITIGLDRSEWQAKLKEWGME